MALELNSVAVVNIFPALNNAEVIDGYEDRFNLSWINPVKATLIIFNVSGADEGEFACRLTSIGGGSKIWARKIHVTVVGKHGKRNIVHVFRVSKNKYTHMSRTSTY